MSALDNVLKILPLLGKISLGSLFGCRRYRHFFEDGLDPYIIADLEGRLVAVNDAFCDALGYDRAHLVGKKFMNFVHEDDQPATIERMERLREGGVVIGFRNRYRTGHGHYVEFEWRARSNGEVIAVARVVVA